VEEYLSLGDAVYLPPSVGGALANTGAQPLTLFSVAVVVPTEGD
jgi:oxalate decarboxylase/phosphoglucose isomerase-like protein (cupin superfamily)